MWNAPSLLFILCHEIYVCDFFLQIPGVLFCFNHTHSCTKKYNNRPHHHFWEKVSIVQLSHDLFPSGRNIQHVYSQWLALKQRPPRVKREQTPISVNWASGMNVLYLACFPEWVMSCGNVQCVLVRPLCLFKLSKMWLKRFYFCVLAHSLMHHFADEPGPSQWEIVPVRTFCWTERWGVSHLHPWIMIARTRTQHTVWRRHAWIPPWVSLSSFSCTFAVKEAVSGWADVPQAS